MKRRIGAAGVGKDGLEAALPFAVAFGHRLRQVREEAGLTGEELAHHVRLFGLEWGRTTVTRIELGQRQLTAAEMLLLPLFFGRPVAELLPTEPVSLTDSAAVGPEELRRGLTEPYRLRAWEVPRFYEGLDTALENMRPVLKQVEADFPEVGVWTVAEAASEGWDDETTAKAARRLGVERRDVAVAAQQLWGVGLAAERDRRLDLSDSGAATARARQAQRGHITRVLLKELRSPVEEIKRARRTEQ